MTLTATASAQEQESRGIDGISAPRGIAIPDTPPNAPADPAPTASPDRTVAVPPPSPALTTHDQPTGRVVRLDLEDRHDDRILVIAAARAGNRATGPAVFSTDDAGTDAMPVVIAPSLGSAAGVAPRVTTRVRSGIRRNGPAVITIDRAGRAAPTVVAANQTEAAGDGPTVITTAPADDGAAKPALKYLGRRLNN